MKLTECRIRGKKMWCLDSRGGSGKRVREFFDSKAKGQKAYKDAVKDAHDLGDAWGKLTAREKVDVMAALDHARGDGKSLDEALHVIRTAKVGPRTSITLKKAITETLEAKEAANRRDSYVTSLKHYLTAFAKGRENDRVDTVGARDIEDWFTGRKEKPETRKSNLGRLSALFDYCWRRGYILENPCKRVERVSVDSRTPAVLSVRQAAKCLAWARWKQPDFLAWITLTLFVGLRPEAEADVIDWSVIDLERKRIRIEGDATKVRQHRIVDLNLCPPALAWLKVAEELKSPLQIPNATRRRWLRKLRAVLGFKRWPQDILRHTAASNLLAIHQDAGKVASFLGNSAGTLLRNYKALIFREDAEKFMKLLPKKRHHPKTRLRKNLVPSASQAHAGGATKK